MMNRRLLLAAAAALIASPAFAQECDQPFHWSGPEGAVSVWPSSDLIRIELNPAEQTPAQGVPSGAVLILDAAAGRPDFSDAGLSLSAPAVVVGPRPTRVRIGYGDRRPGPAQAAQPDILPRGDGPDLVSAWMDYQRRSPAGPAAVRRFRRAGSIAIALDGAPVRARYDWSGVEALAARARAHLRVCPAI